MSRARAARLANVLFLDGFRAAPGWMAWVSIMLILGSVASTCYPLGYRVLVDGALGGSSVHVVEGVAIVGGLLAVGWLLTSVGATDAMALSDRIAIFRTAKMIRLVAGVGGLEHLERPEYLARVEQLNSNRRQLASAPRTILSNTSAAARIITLLVLMASVSPWLLLLPICAVPPVVADRFAKRIAKRADDQMADTRRLASMIFGLTADAGSAGEVRSYGLTEHLAAEHRRCTEELNRRSARESLLLLGVQGSGWLLYAAGLMGAVAFVVIRAADGGMSLGTVLMTVSLIRRSRTQLASATQTSGSLVSTLNTADRLFWLEDHAAEQDAAAGRLLPPARLVQGIRLRDVGFHYPGTERVVLEHLDLDLPAGATVALIGENGSGKTTLVKLLLGFYQPDEGEINVESVPLSQLAPDAWRARCTAAFQDFARLQMPAVHTIGVADLPGLDDEPAALAALTRAGGEDLPGQLPDGLNTRVGTAYTAGRPLSGGQWQKLALGRAMRRDDPLLVVLDEPTASLDAQAEHALFDRYATAARLTAQRTGAITVLVSHRLSTVLMADLIVYLEGGRIVEAGPHAQLLRDGGRYAELFELQAAAYR